MYRIQNIMIYAWIIICSLLSTVLLVAYKITKNKRIVNWYICYFARSTNFVAGNNVVLVDRENLDDTKETYLMVANHESYFDIFSLSGISKDFICVFVAKKELKKTPIIGSWLKALDAVFLDRENPREAIKQMQVGTKQLKAGMSMGIFPEGTRSPIDGEFKAGSIKFATKAKVTIIPVTIRNAGASLERRTHFGKNNTYMQFHTPIKYDDYKDMEIVDIAAQIQNTIQAVSLDELVKNHC